MENRRRLARTFAAGAAALVLAAGTTACSSGPLAAAPAATVDGHEISTRDVLARNAAHPGHVFNLGHGVMPETDPSVLERIVDLVHAEGRCDGVAHPGERPLHG